MFIWDLTYFSYELYHLNRSVFSTYDKKEKRKKKKTNHQYRLPFYNVFKVVNNQLHPSRQGGRSLY